MKGRIMNTSVALRPSTRADSTTTTKKMLKIWQLLKLAWGLARATGRVFPQVSAFYYICSNNYLAVTTPVRGSFADLPGKLSTLVQEHGGTKGSALKNSKKGDRPFLNF